MINRSPQGKPRFMAKIKIIVAGSLLASVAVAPSPSHPAFAAVVYCTAPGVPARCVARPAGTVGAPGVGVAGVGAGAPGVGVAPANRGGPVNRVGVR